jgi:AcrR family transcriptional regulator
MEIDSQVFNRRKNPQQARSGALVDALVEATVRVLSADGYKGATTKRIAQVAGVSVGSLYQYFPNKEALVYAVSQRHYEDLLGRLALISLAPTRQLREAVAEFVQCMIDGHALDPEVHRAVTEQMLRLGPDSYAETQQRALAMVEGLLRARSAEVKVRDPAFAAWLLVTTAEGAVHAALMEEQARLLEPSFAPELTEILCAYIGI